MDELNFVGGGFDGPDSEQYYNELAANSLHMATCITPWELPNACFHCSTPSRANDPRPPTALLYLVEQQTIGVPSKTYAQVAGMQQPRSLYDATWKPLAEPPPACCPRSASITGAATVAMLSQPGQYQAQPQRQHQPWPAEDAEYSLENAMPNPPSQLTYAEVVQQANLPRAPHSEYEPSTWVDEGLSLYNDSFGIHNFFTSTENSSGLPNQAICGTPQHSPLRTIRTPVPRIAPYPVRHTRRLPEVSITTLTLPELNSNPRDPFTLVQRTGRGGHRELISPALCPSGVPSPLSGTLSTGSAASRARRKGDAMKDPTLPYRCSKCGSTYPEKEALKRHTQRTHRDVQERPHPCLQPDCTWRFVNPKDLKRHEKIHAPNAAPAFPCPHFSCMKSYTRRDNMNRHMRSEHADDSGLGTSRSSSEYAGMSRSSSSFSQVR